MRFRLVRSRIRRTGIKLRYVYNMVKLMFSSASSFLFDHLQTNKQTILCCWKISILLITVCTVYNYSIQHLRKKQETTINVYCLSRMSILLIILFYFYASTLLYCFLIHILSHLYCINKPCTLNTTLTADERGKTRFKEVHFLYMCTNTIEIVDLCAAVFSPTSEKTRSRNVKFFLFFLFFFENAYE